MTMSDLGLPAVSAAVGSLEPDASFISPAIKQSGSRGIRLNGQTGSETVVLSSQLRKKVRAGSRRSRTRAAAVNSPDGAPQRLPPLSFCSLVHTPPEHTRGGLAKSPRYAAAEAHCSRAIRAVLFSLGVGAISFFRIEPEVFVLIEVA